MTMTQHPTIETLSGYVLSPDNQDYRDVRRHLQACEPCRLRSDQLSTLSQRLRHEVPLYKASLPVDVTDATDITTEEAASLIQSGQGLTAEQLKTIRQSPAAMKAALHSLTHSAAMQRDIQQHVSPETTTTSDSIATQTRKTNLLEWLKQFVTIHPAWLSIPTTAVVIFVLTLGLTGQLRQHSDLPLVTAYQDNPVVNFQPAGAQHPGIGFFSNVPSTSRPFAPVQVTVSFDGILALQWPAINKAVDYAVQIAEIQGDNPIQLFQQITNKPQIRFIAFKPHKGRRYTWTISGKVQDGQQFKAQGGFVIQ